MFVTGNLVAFAALLGGLVWLRSRGLSLAQQILAGVLAGGLYGSGLQFAYGSDHAAIQATLEWTNVIGASYVNLLHMIVMPLVLVMMIAAVVKMRELAELGRIGGAVIGVLVATTMLAALVGILVANLFGLSADAITQGARELAQAQLLEQRQESLADLGLADMLVRLVPQNLFADLTGARPTSIIAVVVFGTLFGIATLGVMQERPERAAAIVEGTETLRLIIMKLVRLIMVLTPYGICALIIKVVAGSDVADMANLLVFILASYVAIALMFGVHGLLLWALGGVDLRSYLAKAWPVLVFAFTSRSSAATIPLNVEMQVRALRISPPIANLAATFGATIGQNGCAGIYPAMLAVMIAPSMGVDPLAPDFMLGLILIVAVSSFGIAGVGGGATFAALAVLPALGFPVTVAATLIAVEPLIDMARTALNVNGSITAGVVTERWFGARMRPGAALKPAGLVSEASER